MEDNQSRQSYFKFLSKAYEKQLDQYIFKIKERYIFTASLYLIFIIRVLYLKSYFVVCYILGLFVLHCSIQFFTPLGSPDIDDDEEENNVLPQQQHNLNQRIDFQERPMIRNISEFKYWQYLTNSVLVSLVCSLFPFLDIPVFWPFLFLYFISLVIITIQKILKHKQKFGYNFFDRNKWNQK